MTDHAGFRVGADLGAGAGISYIRYLGHDLFKATPKVSAQLDVSAHYVFENVLGLGLHLGGAFVPFDAEVEGEVLAGDVGPSLLLRVPFGRTEATLRLPFGLTLAGGTTRQKGGNLLGLAVGGLTTSNELGVGAHAAALLGVFHWLTESLALHIETGPWWRAFYRDEISATYTRDSIITHTTEKVTHGLVTWSFTLGLHWGAGKRSRP